MEMLKNLFDFKFDSLISPKIIRAIYAALAVIITVVGGVLTLTLIDATNGLSLVLVPLGWAIYLGIIRIIFEAAIVRFQMAQDIREIKKKYLS
jgi:hypothetical protein